MFGRCGFTSPVEGVTLRGLLGQLPQFIPPLVSPSSPPLHYQLVARLLLLSGGGGGDRYRASKGESLSSLWAAS